MMQPMTPARPMLLYRCTSGAGDPCPREDETPDQATVDGDRDRAAEDTVDALPTLLDSYLREIRHTPLLKPEEEVELARRVEQGDTAAAIALAQANLRLVVSQARCYLHCGLLLEDVIAEGNIGLLHAVQKYDWQRGCRFSTFAVWWIRQAITRALTNSGRTIRVSSHGYEALNKRSKVVGQLTSEVGREPTPEEVHAALGDDAPFLDAAVIAARAPLSLSMTVGEDGGEQLGDALPDESAMTTEEDAVRSVAVVETKQLIQQVMRDVLTAREGNVLTLRFGLNDSSPQSLDVIGRRLGVTRERVRQIEEQALRKLRKPVVATRLIDSG